MGRRIRQLCLLAVAAGLLWVAAPALSTTPYMPAAVDFSQPLGGVGPVGNDTNKAGGRPGEGPVTQRSAALEAPMRFDLVGVAGERRPLEIRARTAGGAWTDWAEIANGDPLYVGGAEFAQVRARGWRPEGRLHYVNVSGTTSAAESALTSARRALNAAFVSVSALASPEAEATVGKPNFVTRKDWGADRDQGGCHPRTRPSYGKVKAVAVHHTVSVNNYSAAEAPGIVLGICRYHRNGNGWNDIGYNALVDRFGTLYAGRAGGLDRAVVGAHAQGYNATTAGIASIANHTSSPPSGATLTGFSRYLAWKLSLHGHHAKGKTTVISAGGDQNRYPQGKEVTLHHIYPHGAVDYTACPGDRLRGQLKLIRRKTAQRMG
ncbi:MAG: N-acetylmuramoyl-L-alanine amidase [Solirubrobacterales bacterium]